MTTPTNKEAILTPPDYWKRIVQNVLDYHAKGIYDAKTALFKLSRSIEDDEPTVAASPSVQGESIDSLHAAIMNISCPNNPPFPFCSGPAATDQLRAYKEGHRDARHAAAELVSARLARTAAPSDEVRQAHAQLSEMCVADLDGGKPATLQTRIAELYSWYTDTMSPHAAPSEGLAIPAASANVIRQECAPRTIAVDRDQWESNKGGVLAVLPPHQRPLSNATEQAKPELADEDAYAASGYRHFMDFEKFKAFRAECSANAAQPVPQASGERDAMRNLTDAEVISWAWRNDVEKLSIGAARCAIEDAISISLTDPDATVVEQAVAATTR